MSKTRRELLEVELMSVVDGTVLNRQGYALFLELDKALDNGTNIKLSLKDTTPMSTSFLSSSFGELFDKYGTAKLRKHISLTNYTRSNAETISNYLQDLGKLAK